MSKVDSVTHTYTKLCSFLPEKIYFSYNYLIVGLYTNIDVSPQHLIDLGTEKTVTSYINTQVFI